MPAKTAAERKLIAQKAIASRWAKTPAEERRKAAEKATAAFLSTFEKAVDPEGILPPAERAFRADHARKAHFSGLALKSAQARRARGGVR